VPWPAASNPTRHEPRPHAENPFAGNNSGIQKRETAARWALRVGSYIVVIITLAIMLHIFIKGAPVTFQSKWPFVNTQFLTELPPSFTSSRTSRATIYETGRERCRCHQEAARRQLPQ
jgi:hypothetical protein